MSDNQGEFSKSCHFQMMVYILCVDGSSGVEEPGLVRQRASAMRSERETPNGHRGYCRQVFALIRSLVKMEASWNISVTAEIGLIICSDIICACVCLFIVIN